MTEINQIIGITPRPVPVGQQPLILVVRIRHPLKFRVEARVGVLGELDAFFFASGGALTHLLGLDS